MDFKCIYPSYTVISKSLEYFGSVPLNPMRYNLFSVHEHISKAHFAKQSTLKLPVLSSKLHPRG